MFSLSFPFATVLFVLASSLAGAMTPGQRPSTTWSVFQESISDFYWYYSGKDIIDEQGQRNFSKAIQVAKQVFNTLTEYIQVNMKTFLLLEKRKEVLKRLF